MSVNFYEESPLRKFRAMALQPIGNSISRMGVKKKKTNRLSFVLGLLVVIAITGIYAGALADKTFPVAEGWYTQYADLINQGAVPYRDFEYLFFPLYMYIISGITAIFGYQIMVLRIVGVLVFIGIGVAAYLIFSECFDVIPSAVAGAATTMFLQSEVVQIFYDYIRFMDLFIYIAILFLIRAMRDYTVGTKRVPLNAVLAGLFSAAACLVKQSCGILFICYCIVLFLFIALVGSSPKRALVHGGAYLLACGGAIGAMMCYLASQQALQPFFDLTLGGAVSAKGGMGTVLFGWIGNLFLTANTFMPAVVVLVLLLALNMWLTYQYPVRKAPFEKNRVLIAFGAGTVAVLLLCLFCKPVAEYFSAKVIQITPAIIYVPVAFLFFGMGIYYLVVRFSRLHPNRTFVAATLPFFALLGSIFAIGYGSGTSGGLCESQTALALGVLLAVALQFSQHYYEKIAQTLVILFGCAIIAVTCSRKIVTPYSWWGQSINDIWQETETTNIPLLAGIKVSSAEKQMLEGVCGMVEQYSEPGDTMYAFPQIPIFYKMCNRASISYTQVQWFDVSTEKGMYTDMQRLCAAPPKVLVVCNVPESVSSAHESSFNDGQPSQERIMGDFLLSFAENNGYMRVGGYPMATNYSIDVYISTDATTAGITYDQYWEDMPEASRYYIRSTLAKYCNDAENMEFYVGQAKAYYNAYDREFPVSLKKLTLAGVASLFDGNASGFVIDKTVYLNLLNDSTYTAIAQRLADQFVLCKVEENDVILVAKDKAKTVPKYATATVRYAMEQGFYEEDGIKIRDYVWASKDGQMLLSNFNPTDRDIILHMEIYAKTKDTGSLVVRCGDQVYETYVNTDAGQRTVVNVPMTLAPGKNIVTLHTTLQRYDNNDEEDTRILYYQLCDFSIETPGLFDPVTNKAIGAAAQQDADAASEDAATPETSGADEPDDADTLQEDNPESAANQ